MREPKSKPNFTKKQLTSIGYKDQSQIPHLYWNEKIKGCFKTYKCCPRERKHLQNQPFQEFKDMALDGANEHGTSRFRFQDIEKIEFSIISRKDLTGINNNLTKASKKDIKNKKIMQKKTQEFEQTQNVKVAVKAIEEILTSFFQIEARHNQKIKLAINQKTNLIQDINAGTEYQVNCGQGTNNQRSIYDFWQLFDVGMRYKKKYRVNKNKKIQQKQTKSDETKKQCKNSILLFFIEADLMQGQNSVDGRATGDGIAFVSFKRQDFLPIDLQSTFLDQQYACYPLPILIHECLHTLGFQHCSAWECLMNSVTNNEFLLCPCCVRKFQDQMSYKIDLKNWYQNLEKALTTIRKTMEEKYGDKKCLRLFADILYSKDQFTKKTEKTQENIIIQKINQPKDYSMLEKCQLITGSFQI